ncbi:capsular polysaccharide export protein, LipB/KpsS family [Aureispira anguillae]|uniref:Capsule polysaccharide biosynthesis protein n=1 Tax=Aureispira anguillae TaxID=2864201 RepID=A0A916DTY7_9BACT|nr:hypothetical protein [Aureispira anguillae]BDS13674.1 hypothetical protein AsAng_0044150 [Aureispira anguillae]
MKIMFFEPYTRHSPHFEYCLEQIQVHLDKGNEVFFVGCNAEFSACDNNLFHSSAICKSCVERCDKGISLLSKKVKINNSIIITPEEQVIVDEYIQKVVFNNVEELKKIKFRDFDLGMGVASSLITHFRNPYFDVKRNKRLIRNYIESSIKVYLSLKRYVEDEKIDAIHIFNGRLAHLRPALRVAEEKGIDYYTHEAGASRNKYAIYKNMMPHNFTKRRELIREFWESADKNERVKMGASFYEDQATGRARDKSFHHVKDQKKNALPSNWDASKTNLVIFNSSEDEFAAIASKRSMGVYPSQLVGIQKMVEGLKDNEDYHIYLRIHPNLRNANKKILEELYQITAPNLTILGPKDPTSTYELIDKATAVITFISTVGIEAAFRGKIAIVVGNAMYSDLGGTYAPKSQEEVISLLNKVKDLPPLDKEGAYIYGYYRKYYGILCKYYESEGLSKGKFKGVNLDDACSALPLTRFFEKLQWVRKHYFRYN